MYGYHYEHHHGPKTAIIAMGLVSVALTVPFIFYAKAIADSLHTIAHEK